MDAEQHVGFRGRIDFVPYARVERKCLWCHEFMLPVRRRDDDRPPQRLDRDETRRAMPYQSSTGVECEEHQPSVPAMEDRFLTVSIALGAWLLPEPSQHPAQIKEEFRTAEPVGRRRAQAIIGSWHQFTRFLI